MEIPRKLTEDERGKGELYQRLREWLMEWKKDDLVLLATALMVENGLRKK